MHKNLIHQCFYAAVEGVSMQFTRPYNRNKKILMLIALVDECV